MLNEANFPQKKSWISVRQKPQRLSYVLDVLNHLLRKTLKFSIVA